MPSRNSRAISAYPRMQGTPVTPVMLAAMEAMKAGALERFRVGWGATHRGPFFLFGTIDGLVARGLVTFTLAGKRAFLTRDGLDALAATRADHTTKSEAA